MVGTFDNVYEGCADGKPDLLGCSFGPTLGTVDDVMVVVGDKEDVRLGC